MDEDLREILLGILVMQQRLYDIQMAMLDATNKEMADFVFDEHEAGKLLNPSLLIPDYTREEPEALSLDTPEHDYVVPPAPHRPEPLDSPVEGRY